MHLLFIANKMIRKMKSNAYVIITTIKDERDAHEIRGGRERGGG